MIAPTTNSSGNCREKVGLKYTEDPHPRCDAARRPGSQPETVKQLYALPQTRHETQAKKLIIGPVARGGSQQHTGKWSRVRGAAGWEMELRFPLRQPFRRPDVSGLCAGRAAKPNRTGMQRVRLHREKEIRWAGVQSRSSGKGRTKNGPSSGLILFRNHLTQSTTSTDVSFLASPAFKRNRRNGTSKLAALNVFKSITHTARWVPTQLLYSACSSRNGPVNRTILLIQGKPVET